MTNKFVKWLNGFSEAPQPPETATEQADKAAWLLVCNAVEGLPDAALKVNINRKPTGPEQEQR